jgi:hypothetical protein
VSNWDVTGFYPNGTSPGTHKIYGNYFHSSVASGAAIWFYATITADNGTWLIYNNTFKDIANGAIYTDNGASPTGSVSNNIFYNHAFCWWGSLAHDYNWYSGSGKYNEPNGIAGGSSNPFATAPSIVSTIGAAFPRNKGSALTAEYATDLSGNTRGADGAWDIGAYEYNGGGSVTNPVISVSPGSLDFGSVAVGSSNELDVVVRNVGGGTLVGMGSVSTPFSIVTGGTYSLGSNQAQTVRIRYQSTGTGSYSQAVSFTGAGGTSVMASAVSGLTFEVSVGVTNSTAGSNSGGYINLIRR